MKEGIHPDYKQTTITCACGEVIETGSTKENIQVEIQQNIKARLIFLQQLFLLQFIS